MSMSHQHDVVLLLVIHRFYLQRDRFADRIAQHGKALRFFVQEQIDYRLRSEYTELACVELARFAHYLAQDFVAHGLCGFDFAAPLAHRTRLAQCMRETLARTLARHFDQTKRSEAVDRDPR